VPFQFKRLDIPEVVLIEPKVFSDDRGFFLETYKYSDFSKFGITGSFVQSNHSKSAARGVVRGLHFQKSPFSQAKLVRVVSGKILDVAVDVRKNSPTYGKYVSVQLCAQNKAILYIPCGFAHGFCTLEENTEVVYKTDKEFSLEHDRGVIWNDKDIGIKWPVENPILSAKDQKWPALKQADVENE